MTPKSKAEIRKAFEANLRTWLDTLDARIKCDCEHCDECVYIGEGALACMIDYEPVLVIENFTPTDKYGWCKAKYRGEE